LRQAAFIVFIIVLLIAGGLLTYGISRQGAGIIPGIRLQTNNPEASVVSVTPDKGALFFIYSAIVLGSVVGMGATLAILFWFLNRQVVEVKQMPNHGFEFTSLNPARPNSLGDVITRHPAITIVVVIGLIVVLSIAAAILTGAFSG
jgi:hypothetical protein